MMPPSLHACGFECTENNFLRLQGVSYVPAHPFPISPVYTAKQRKVTALSGAHPDTPARRGHKQKKKAHLEARPEAKEA